MVVIPDLKSVLRAAFQLVSFPQRIFTLSKSVFDNPARLHWSAIARSMAFAAIAATLLLGTAVTLEMRTTASLDVTSVRAATIPAFNLGRAAILLAMTQRRVATQFAFTPVRTATPTAREVRARRKTYSFALFATLDFQFIWLLVVRTWCKQKLLWR